MFQTILCTQRLSRVLGTGEITKLLLFCKSLQQLKEALNTHSEYKRVEERTVRAGADTTGFEMMRPVMTHSRFRLLREFVTGLPYRTALPTGRQVSGRRPNGTEDAHFR